MKIKLLFLILIIALAGYAYYYRNNSNTEPMTQSCIETFMVSNNDPTTYYMPSIGETIKALPFDGSVTPFVIDTVPADFVGLDRDEHVVVNNTYFSDLTTVDATDTSERRMIGTYIGPESHTPKNVIISLIKSQVISTYWHLQADLCLTQEDDTDSVYRAHFNGSHEYCTNECITEDYEFIIEYDKESGDILLPPTPLQ